MLSEYFDSLRETLSIFYSFPEIEGILTVHIVNELESQAFYKISMEQ